MEPITASESGKNTYYLGGCKATEHNPAYCACLNKIKRHMSGQDIDSRCTGAITFKTCQALHMRQAEELAGEALYFVPREQWQAGLVKAPAWSTPPTPTPAPTCAPATTSPVSAPTNHRNKKLDGKLGGTFADAANAYATASYADAINEAMKSSVAPVSAPPPAPTPTPAPAPVAVAQAPVGDTPRLPGESPIAFAQRRARARKGEKA